MCGISGLLTLDQTRCSEKTVQAMTQELRHRGPNDAGVFIDGPIGLGHRRLTIVDLSSAGHQPMINHQNRFVISYNGEIYNYRELKEQLTSEGVSFKSSTDTEVLLEGFAKWGPSILDKLNGMFAFAIWDKEKRSLFLARDRYGIKPLYYLYIPGKVIAFASEIKALLRYPSYQPEMDRAGLSEYITFQNIYTDKTLFKNIRLLPPGSYLTFSLNQKGTITPKQYWDFHFTSPELNDRPADDYQEEFLGLFKKGVERQLIGDVKIGSYLSGGLDSGAITATASSKLPYISTFTVGFDLSAASDIELGFDEREVAEHISSLYQTEHYEMVLKAGDMERCLPKHVWHLEEPRVGQSYPNFYASRLASKFVKVVLSGTGGDELFGGYPWRYYQHDRTLSFDSFTRDYFFRWLRLVPKELFKSFTEPLGVKLEDMQDVFSGVFPAEMRKALSSRNDYLNASLYFEAKTFLQGLFLVEDKLSMAHGLETRVPFLDNDLVEFAMTLPAQLKVQLFSKPQQGLRDLTNPRHKKNKTGKLLLRQALKRIIPDHITEGRKQGFSAPDATWFRGRSLDFVKRELLDSNAPVYQYFSYPCAKRLIKEHIEGASNHRLLIWSLLYLNEFCNQFLMGTVPSDHHSCHYSQLGYRI